MRTSTEKLNIAGSRGWLYFTDLNECIDNAKELDGSIDHEPITIAGLGCFTMICDPDGVCFSIIEFNQMF